MSFKKAMKVISKTAPNWLTVGALIFGGLTVKLALDCHIPAKEAKENIKEREESGETINIKEKFLIMTPIVWKPVVTGTIAVGCALGANKIAMKRLATLGSTLELTQSIKNEYQRQVEKLDPETAKKINDAVDDKIADIAPSPKSVKTDIQYDTLGSSGDQLFYDACSGRYFYSSGDYLKAALSDFKSMLNAAKNDGDNDKWRTLNDYYDCAGLEETDTGDILGWHYDDADYIRYQFSGSYTKDMKSYIIIRFYPSPVPIDLDR